MRTCILFTSLVLMAVPSLTHAQEPSTRPPVEVSSERHRARLDVPLLDLPYNASPWYTGPGMGVSVGLTAGVYTGVQVGLSAAAMSIVPIHEDEGVFRIVGREALYNFMSLLAVGLTVSFPGFTGFNHEEGHLGVLNARGVSGRNSTLGIPDLSSPFISIDEVDDDDLVRLKRDHNPDMVRAGAAGIEAELQMVERMEREEFLFGRSTRMYSGRALVYLVIMANSASYVQGSAQVGGQIDALTDELNRTETTIAERDFIGGDFTAWTIDLHRPDQTYEQTRGGAHQSGVGLNRYLKSTDLTDEERTYLEGVGALMWLNLVDPNVAGISAFNIPLSDGSTLRAMANLRTYLTSFGYTVNVDSRWKHGDLALEFSLMNQFSRDLYHPGVSARLMRWPLWRSGERGVFASPRAVAWTQPRDQRFDASERDLGGALELELEANLLGPFGLRAMIGAKTAGWLAGNPFLDQKVYGNMGLTATF